MIIKRVTNPFIPVVITLETAGELTVLQHIVDHYIKNMPASVHGVMVRDFREALESTKS